MGIKFIYWFFKVKYASAAIFYKIITKFLKEWRNECKIKAPLWFIRVYLLFCNRIYARNAICFLGNDAFNEKEVILLVRMLINVKSPSGYVNL